jgi:hypothetical protein
VSRTAPSFLRRNPCRPCPSPTRHGWRESVAANVVRRGGRWKNISF